MYGRRIFLYMVLILTTSLVRVNGATEVTGAVLVDKILYATNLAPDRGIYYMDLDGSGKTEIVFLAPREGLEGFSISPSGSKIAYGVFDEEAGKAGVYLADVDGSDKTELVTGVFLKYGPVFTPDGRELVFITGYPGEAKLFSITLGEKAPIGITEEVPNMNYASFSPDVKFAIFSYEDGETAGIGRCDIESNRVKYISEKGVLAYSPRVSPDGKLIAYGVWENDKLHLCVMDSEGKNSRRLTFDKNVGPWQFRFSPDSKNIVFTAEGKDGLLAIYKIGVDGTNETRLTFNRSNDIGPVYSPDGRFIAFVSSGRDTREIFIMNSDGTELKRLTPEGINGNIVFSPMLLGNTIIDSDGNTRPLDQ